MLPKMAVSKVSPKGELIAFLESHTCNGHNSRGFNATAQTNGETCTTPRALCNSWLSWLGRLKYRYLCGSLCGKLAAPLNKGIVGPSVARFEVVCCAKRGKIKVSPCLKVSLAEASNHNQRGNHFAQLYKQSLVIAPHVRTLPPTLCPVSKTHRKRLALVLNN